MTAAIETITLHFVRHGETASNAERRFQHPETPLSGLGREQAVAVAETLAGLNAELILASDYARA
jgi:glucosyl-3-phosphoglycerate phosphatase